MTGIRLKWRIFPQKVMLLQQQYATADIYKLKFSTEAKLTSSVEIVRFPDIIVTVEVATIFECHLF